MEATLGRVLTTLASVLSMLGSVSITEAKVDLTLASVQITEGVSSFSSASGLSWRFCNFSRSLRVKSSSGLGAVGLSLPSRVIPRHFRLHSVSIVHHGMPVA